MKKLLDNESLFSTDKSKLAVDNSLKESYQRDLNSPFIQRKMAQATAFLDKHGLPEGWGEWKKQEDVKAASSTTNSVPEQKEQE